MADYTNSTFAIGSALPDRAIETPAQKVEPLITPRLVRTRHLLGLDLVSGHKSKHVFTDAEIQDLIDGAVSQAETELKIDIMPIQRREKHPFDQNLLNAFGYFQLPHRPISSVDQLAIAPTQRPLYIIPPVWIEPGGFQYGRVNLLPFMTAGIQALNSGTAAGSLDSVFVSLMSQWTYIVGFWMIDYTCGWADGMVPRIINEYIGTLAAIEILSALAATYARTTSHSIGIDSMSQSQAGPGGQMYLARLQDLQTKLKGIGNKVKGQFGMKFGVSTL